LVELAAMTRPHLKYAAVLAVLLCAGVAQAEAASVRVQTKDTARFSQTVLVHFASTRGFAVGSTLRVTAEAFAHTLPPEPKPTTHWPWWLRILAVIGVLVFIRIVAGSVRSKPSGPGPV
jgi:hypothetical protein